jgi:sn-glycerol 3-phosphate transport system substrate-binding protein
VLKPSWYVKAAFILWLTVVIPAHSQRVEILFWHALAGKLGDEVRQLTEEFNQSQSKFTVRPVYKGNYLETLTSFAAAFHAHQPPAIVQIFEVGTPTMLNPPGIIKPVGKLMLEQGIDLPIGSFFPVVREQYSQNQQLMAMPFNISVPVIFYNADALGKLGYQEKNFPKTWSEFEILAKKLRDAGSACSYTSAYPAWVLFESFSALHNKSMLNGQQAHYNSPAFVRHLQRLKRWQSLHYFEYGGRTDEGTFLFTSSRCAMLSQSSGAYTSLTEAVSFKVGMAALPLDTHISRQRFNNVAGGAALWAVAGQSAMVYKGTAEFFAFLAQPEVQKHWHLNTGYLPLGIDGIYKTVFATSDHPSLRIARTDLSVSSAVLLGVQNQIRLINDEALEAVFAGIKTPKAALDDAVHRANHALLRFAQNTGMPILKGR